VAVRPSTASPHGRARRSAQRYGSTSPCHAASPRRRGRATPPRCLAEPSSNRGALLPVTIEHATSPTMSYLCPKPLPASRRIRAIPATTTCPCFHLVASPTRRAPAPTSSSRRPHDVGPAASTMHPAILIEQQPNTCFHGHTSPSSSRAIGELPTPNSTLFPSRPWPCRSTI
jgi:hypothetical protein